MKLAAILGALMLCLTPLVHAQTGTSRAWQQRINVSVDLPVPVVELASANPFAIEVDEPPRLLASTPPKKIDVRGTAVVAAYVNSKGDCLGGVPLELPFPGLTSALLVEIEGVRFDAAAKDQVEVNSWVVFGVGFAGRIKESAVSSPTFELPDQATPPAPAARLRVAPPGRLLNAGFEPQDSLSTLASPRRLKVKAPSQEADVPIRALVHITAGGRCDRFVPLNIETGLHSWLSAYLASWRLDPATLDGQSHEAWVVYSARGTLKISSLNSDSITVLRNRSYEPPTPS